MQAPGSCRGPAEGNHPSPGRPQVRGEPDHGFPLVPHSGGARYGVFAQAQSAGRPSRLSASQLAEVREMFAAGPRAFGFDTDRWTTARLAQAIEGRFAIRYDPDL